MRSRVVKTFIAAAMLSCLAWCASEASAAPTRSQARSYDWTPMVNYGDPDGGSSSIPRFGRSTEVFTIFGPLQLPLGGLRFGVPPRTSILLSGTSRRTVHHSGVTK